MDLQLKDKVAVISGATKGIGRAIAELLAQESCRLGICARDAAEVEQAVAELSRHGVAVYGAACDVRDADAYAQWVARCAEELGGIDCFVPNVSAGGFDSSEAGWLANLELDMLGTVRGINAAMPYLEQSDCGAVLVIATSAAVEKFAGPTPYAAMKAALLNYAGNLAMELAPKGIRVNAVSPGPVFVESGMWDQVKQGMPPVYEATLAACPMGRMATAEEVAFQALCLLSPRASYTTGSNVVVDGGFTQRIQY